MLLNIRVGILSLVVLSALGIRAQERNDIIVSNLFDSGSGSLREAVESANDLGKMTAIDATGLSGVIRLLSPLVIRGQIQLNGPGSDELTISGDLNEDGEAGIDDLRCVLVATTAQLEINGMTLNGGFANRGGAINVAGFLKGKDVVLQGNAASFEGGGLWVDVTGTATLEDWEFNGNWSARFGGAVHNRGRLNLINCSFEENRANEIYGGAIHNAGELWIQGSTFLKNWAGDEGGAIMSGGNTVTRITATTFSQNSTNGSGGVISNYGSATIQNSTFYNNSSEGHGGVFRVGSTSGSSTEVGNCTFSGNRAAGNGGVVTTGFDGIALRNCTLVLNQCGGNGPAIVAYNEARVRLYNCIVAGNSSSGVNQAADVTGQFVDEHNSLIGLAGHSGLAVIVDPILSDNGGPTLSHAQSRSRASKPGD